MNEVGRGSAPGPTPSRAVVVGPGRVGLALAEGLDVAELHRRLQVVGRDEGRPAFLVGRPGISYRPADGWSPPDVPGPLELFLAVPDRSLEDVARGWASRLREAGLSPAFAFHTSGARDAGVLGPLAGLGAEVAVLHPLRAVAAPAAGALAGAWFGVLGSEGGRRRAEVVAAALGGRTLRVRPGASSRYHAAAVMASNLLVGELELARGELRQATDAGEEAVDGALRDLAESALREAAGREGAAGLTGPLARGDLETLEEHLRVLPPETAAAYSALTRALARRVLALEGERLAEVEAILDRSGVPEHAGANAEGEDEE